MKKDIHTIFENIRREYGDVASWAVWKDHDGNNLASNMEVDGLFDLDKNPEILYKLNNNVIMVGYNFSIPTDNFPKLHNFHTYNGANMNHTTLRNASKIRYAFNGTPYSGAYMTDIIKNHVESRSEKVVLSNLDEHIQIFRKELETLQADKPIIIAFGHKVFTLLEKHFNSNESKLIEITHYAYYSDPFATHEGYRKSVLNQIEKRLNFLFRNA